MARESELKKQVSKYLKGWIEAQWREYPHKRRAGKASDFKDFLLLKVRKDLNDVETN